MEGLESAIRRAKIYKEAGADVVFPDALASADEFRSFADELPGWKMANMTEFGRTPHFTATEFPSGKKMDPVQIEIPDGDMGAPGQIVCIAE